MPVDITYATVATVAQQLLGSAGPGEVDSIILHHWLMRFGVAGVGIRQIVKEFGDWTANGRPPWVAYMALMSGLLTDLNKCPRLRPVGVGDIWRRILAKCVLVVTGAEAKEACRTEHICGGLEAGIEGGSMQC